MSDQTGGIKTLLDQGPQLGPGFVEGIDGIQIRRAAANRHYDRLIGDHPRDNIRTAPQPPRRNFPQERHAPPQVDRLVAWTNAGLPVVNLVGVGGVLNRFQGRWCLKIQRRVGAVASMTTPKWFTLHIEPAAGPAETGLDQPNTSLDQRLLGGPGDFRFRQLNHLRSRAVQTVET